MTDLSEVSEKLHKDGVVVTVIADVLSLAITKTPAEMGADIAVGSV